MIDETLFKDIKKFVSNGTLSEEKGEVIQKILSIPPHKRFSLYPYSDIVLYRYTIRKKYNYIVVAKLFGEENDKYYVFITEIDEKRRFLKVVSSAQKYVFTDKYIRTFYASVYNKLPDKDYEQFAIWASLPNYGFCIHKANKNEVDVDSGGFIIAANNSTNEILITYAYYPYDCFKMTERMKSVYISVFSAILRTTNAMDLSTTSSLEDELMQNEDIKAFFSHEMTFSSDGTLSVRRDCVVASKVKQYGLQYLTD